MVCASDQPAALHFHYDLGICAELIEAIPFFFRLPCVLFWWDVDESLHFVAEEAGSQRARSILDFEVKLCAFYGLNVLFAAEAVDEHAAVFPSFPATDRTGVVKLPFDDTGNGAAG